MPKRILEGATPLERASQRRKLGTLRELTVQPSTRSRYNKAIDKFLLFLKSNHLSLPSRKDAMDSIVCEYIEHLWSSGAGRALASDTVAGLQDLTPKLRGMMPGAWRLLKTWSINEIPNRAPPLPEHVLWAMCGWAAFHQQFSFAVSLLVGFYGMLRTGEILSLKHKDFCSASGSRSVLLNLGLTKGGKRVGAAESVVFAHDVVVKALLCWLRVARPSTLLAKSPAIWRSLFNQCIAALQIEKFGFRPYSLRRGGATWWFSKHHSLDKILVQGRWQAAKTARIYINEGLSVLTQLNLPAKDPKVAPFIELFHSHFRLPSFTTLEPPARAGRSGGRGRKRFFQKSRQKFLCLGLYVCFSLYKSLELIQDKGLGLFWFRGTNGFFPYWWGLAQVEE